MNKETDKIFITGASGLVGKELLHRLLDEGYRVRALVHNKLVDYTHPNLEFIEGDVLDVVLLEEAMRGITHVFHSAAIVSYDPSDKYRMLKINVEGTANVVNVCIDSGVQKLVHVSSVAAIGRDHKGETVNEEIQWTEEANKSNYSKSKYLSEMEVWRGIGEGLDAVIVNPSIIFGGDDWSKGSLAIFKSAYNEFSWYSEGVAGFVDVRDVVSAMIQLMYSPIAAERFILNSECLSFREVFTEIANCFGKRPPHRKVTPFLAAIVWRYEKLKGMITGRKPLLTRETAMSSLGKVYYDNSKVLKALAGFTFIPVKDTIAYTCRMLKERNNL
ncbi:MAG TPA: NAD-dependent epimerase/dehydratase family protein [Ginsengibacter sp.]|nr:NAD-dependent epimerase/dehydratase family protein [Ginsengibacter sp.]HRP17081.1 NAD-dependent epimerase/dehydratase family protein [Ginsengibacter sp.]HRP43586.1 NAD-dependent epimerase/dehydratase family protein [Ginsengibacter sp.]